MSHSYNVRFWKTETYQRKKGTTYTIRWSVDGRAFRDSFGTKSLADSFRAELTTAARHGEAFDTETGLPLSKMRARERLSWYELARRYADHKWKHAAASSRRSAADALTTATTALLTSDRGVPDGKLLRHALTYWAFNTGTRGQTPPDEVADALRWLARNTEDVTALEEPGTVRRVLTALGSKLDGSPAAGNTYARRRAVLSNALDYAAIDLDVIEANPLPQMKSRGRKARQEVDRRSVVNPDQARALLAAVGEVQRSGPRLVAFFGLLYFAALRPEEAVNLRAANLSLPESGWGELFLEESTPDVGGRWTDTGERRDRRHLKHRAVGEGRRVPCVPELTETLHRHLEAFPPGASGRLFRSDRYNAIAATTYGAVWSRARRLALTPEQVASPLAKRPYDLRHAAVSTWLNGGVPATQVAEWAGHSVEVLLRVYAKCLEGQEPLARQRIEEALALGRDD